MRHTLVTAAAIVSLCGLTGLGAPQADIASVPADGKIVITDYGYRDWAPALLRYQIGDRKMKQGPVALTDAAGKPVPAQVDGTELRFVASLAKGATATFTLGTGQPEVAAPWPAKWRGDIEVGNEFLKLRLPPVAKRTLKTAAKAADVPAPILAWQPAGGAWMGGSRLVTERLVSSCEFRIVRNGPACFEYEARYQFAPVGEYVCRIRVSPGIDHADITEEYDFGATTEGKDFLVLELQKGFEPATIGWAMPGGEAQRGSTQRQPYKEYIEPKLKSGTNPPAPVGGAGVTPLPPVPEADMVLLEKVLPGGKWGGNKGGVELAAESLAAAKGMPAPRVAVIPMHIGNWRRALALTVWHKPGTGVVVALPISTRRCTWYAEVTDDISPFSSHEHDASLPASYGRREWALYFGSEPGQLQETAGYIGLDEYKNWILDWPETAKPGDFPRAWFTKADIADLKKVMAQHPDRDALAKYYVFSGKTEDAVAHAHGFVSGVVGQHGYLGNWYVGGLSHYRQSQSLMPPAHLADDALACPDLPPDLRRDVRRTLALSAYMMAAPDLNPRGAGVHLGNNNMSVNRTCTLAYFAGCLPDHPLYKQWMADITGFVAYKLASQVAQDGVPIECPTYWLYGPLRFLEPAQTIIRNTGGPDFAARQASGLHYLAQLTVPDARFNGLRIVPGMGNSANVLEGIFGSTLATVMRGNPSDAPLMQRMHRASWPNTPVGSIPPYNCGWFGFQYRPDVPETPADLRTVVLPTYGVVFRNRFGAADETVLLFRAGINWGHWDTDAGNVILYGKGAPLSPGTGYQYYYGAASENEALYHNQVKVGARDQQEVFGRVDDALTDYGFGPSVDYATNSRFYPSQLFKDGKGAMSWNRHVLFLKGGATDYAVLRDTFPGGAGRPTWWSWMNLGTADLVRIDGKAFDKDKTAFDKTVPEAQFPTLSGHVAEFATAFGAGTWMWFANAEPTTFRARLTFTAGNGGLLGLKAAEFPKQEAKETKTIVEAVAKPGADYFYAMVPRKEGEPAPQCERLGDSALKIKTADGTDYVFVSDAPVAFDQDGVVFAGRAGAVRLLADRVVLCLNAGTGKVGYKGMIFEGPGPFERTVKLSGLKPGTTAVTDTYEKKRVTTDLGDGLTVEGEAPFTAKLDGHRIVLSVEGRARVLYVTRPDWIWQPWMTLDGIPVMACWTDYPASGWGKYDRTALMAISVPDGKHIVELTDRVFPPCWPRRFEPTLTSLR